ncbi:Tn3 family transposase [Streptomyces sp. NBC_01717]|uniref:Tn3 family transposase n=1 Tax=Streptomyces sp. NBC_01717 TaxID=2975918 RepID=UPI003FCC5A04
MKSEIGVGIIRLLTFYLLPRIKRINKVKLHRSAAGEADAYPRLTPALTRPIRWEFIAQQYDHGVLGVLPRAAGQPRARPASARQSRHRPTG